MARNSTPAGAPPPPVDPLPPLDRPLQDFALDDSALQRRALARLTQVMESPTLMVRCGKWIDDPRLVRLRLEACRAILGLGPDPASDDEVTSGADASAKGEGDPGEAGTLRRVTG